MSVIMSGDGFYARRSHVRGREEWKFGSAVWLMNKFGF